MGVDAIAEVVDHVVARRFGGALFDVDNLMGMTKAWHEKKSGIESHGPFVLPKQGENGLIPEDRNQVIDRLTQGWGVP